MTDIIQKYQLRKKEYAEGMEDMMTWKAWVC
jgi:hypothetical protein